VIVVIAILAAVAVVAFTGITERAKNVGITSSVSQLIKGFELAKVDEEVYPLQAYVLQGLNVSKPGISGIGNYAMLRTHIVNISDLREAVASKGLALQDIGILGYTNALGALTPVQDSSTGGYFNYPTYNSNTTDQRVAAYLQGAETLDQKISAYDRYQKEVLGLTTVPSVYTGGNVFISTAATGSGRNIPQKRAYPFIEFTMYCNKTSAKCFSSIGYYLFGKDSTCPKLGVGSSKTSGTLLNSFGSGAATNHNMTFCLSYLDGIPPSSFAN
jgi:hypothetical protein